MSDDRSGSEPGEKSWLDKIALLFSSEPRNRSDLEDVLTLATENEVIDEDARSIMEGAMKVSDMQARDIMIPRAQMEVIKADAQKRAQKVAAMVVPMRDAGKSLREIAEALNAAGVQTARGGKWQASQVMRTLERIEA